MNNIQNETKTRSGYEAPSMEVVEMIVERGFLASNEAGFDGPSYGEEDVDW